MADTTAVYRAVADFSSLKRQADAARRSLRQLRTESSDTHQDYVQGQEEVTQATDDSTKANTQLTRVLGQVQKQTRETTQTEGSRVDVLQDTISAIGKQSAAQRENTRLEVEANRAKEKLTLSEAKYQSVAEDAAATDADRAKALDQVRLSSIAAAAATDRLQSSMARLAIGAGGRGGRPRGPGIATDVGAFGRSLATIGSGLVSTLLLVVPTINTIIAGVVGLVALLTAATVAAAAFAAAFITVGAAMGFAAFKWKALLTSSTDGVSEWKAAILAIEASAFNAFKGIMSTFEDTGKAGTSMWDSIIEASNTLINAMEPIFQRVADAIYNFTQALAGVPGAASPFVDFLRTWIEEWKVLKDIVSEDILPGGPGFFTKYEAPAKAFVEGIARVINGIRKFSRMGLGLNMDQLAEFITNVFDALAKLIQIIPRYSNALVTVGLATSKWLDSLIPIIDAGVRIGEVILKDIVAPLVELAGWITTHILNLPIISWLSSLALGFTVAAFGLSKLSFGLISFKALMTGQLIRSLITFVGLVKQFGFLQTVAGYMPGLVSGFQKLQGVVTSLGTALTGLEGAAAGAVGSVAITAVVLVGWFLVNKAMDAARKRAEALGRAATKTRGLLEAGALTISEAYRRLAQSYQDIQAPVVAPARARSLEKLGVDVDKSGEAAEYATEEIQKWGNEISKNAVAGVAATGALTEEQTKYLLILKNGEGTQQNYRNFLMQTNELYDKGVISTAQYAGVLDQLGVTTNAAGEEVDVLALKIEGASNTIADALIDIGKEADLATGGIERFATSMGEDPRQFARDAVAAFNDVENGLLGTGTAVTDWFRDTVDAIEAWKNEVADSFDIVKQAFIDLGGQADLTWDKLKKGIDDAIEAAQDMQDNISYIIKHGASPLLEQLIAENGPALANLYEVLRNQGPKGIHEVNRALREGVDISTGIAGDLADAMGVALEPLLKAVELLISKMLGIPFKEVEQQVNGLVDTAEGDLDRIEKRKPARFAVTTPSEIGFEHKLTPAERRARREGRNLRPPGTRNNTPSELRQYPVPEVELDDKALRTKYETTGRVAVAGGMAAGMVDGTPVVEKAGRTLADAAVTETNKRLGIASPSKVFVTIGKQVVAGFTEGITDPGGWNSAIGAVVSTITGLKNTISEIFTNARSWLGGIIEAFKTLYRVISEDLTPAVGDLKTALENLPETIDIALDLDTTAAETSADAFIEKMKKKGLIFQTDGGTGGPITTQHAGGPAGHGSRYAIGPPRADEVDARLQKGEFVVSRQAVQNMGGMGTMSEFHSFIQGKRLFHNGGPVTESEDVDTRIAKLAQSLGFAGVSATANLPKQNLQSDVFMSAPGAGKTAGGLTAAAANYMAVIKKNFPMVTGYGTIAVRNIAGTSTWSQHAYGNAIDVMTGSSDALRQAVAFFSNTYRRVLSIAHLLADPWFASPLGDHTTHVHADFLPQYGGTPPGQPYRQGGKVRKRGGRVHENEFVLRDSAARALGDPGLNYLNTHADRYGPAAFLEAFNQSFATSSIPTMGGAGGMEDSGGRALFSIAMHLDGKTVSRSVDVHSREADILLPGR